ncbi:MAG: hypothetical protein ABJQ34_08160 [Paracoccaceae bacterium]
MHAPHFPGIFAPEQAELPLGNHLAATPRQIEYARALAKQKKLELSPSLLSNRAALSNWIDKNKAPAPTGRFSAYPSAKQVAFAERIARLKKRQVPHECFRDKTLMSRWIDSHKPH